MLGLSFLCRRSLLWFPDGRSFLGKFWGCCLFVDVPVTRSFSSKIKIDKQSFAVSYLVNSVGFSLEAAILACQRGKLKFANPDAPNEVLALLGDHGFSEDQIFNFVRSQPDLLKYNPKATLWPKIEFFYSVGLSRAQVVELLTSKPYLLTVSLESTLVPWYTFLKGLLCLNSRVIRALKHPSFGISGDMLQDVAANITFLREVRMPDHRISRLVIQQPRALTVKGNEFKELVGKIVEMGFNPLQYNFLTAVIASSVYKFSTLEHKKDIYRRCGWSENDIEMTFKMSPVSLFLSEKKILNGMDFLVKRMGWPLTDITRAPKVLFFSLEKRMIPRCSVIQVLQLKGLINKDVSLCYILTIAEKQFLDKFVTKFQHELPELLRVYHGKVAGLDVIKIV